MAEAHPLTVKFARTAEAAFKAPSGENILEICLEIADLLISKNTAYGNSALEPMRVFSVASPLEQINVRIDDKLSRIRRQSENAETSTDTEDAKVDLLGYLVLEMVARRSMDSETSQ